MFGRPVFGKQSWIDDEGFYFVILSLKIAKFPI